MAAPHALEADVKELRAEITRLASEHASKYDEAEKFVESVKAKNPDTPAYELAEFGEIGEMFAAADEVKEKLAARKDQLTSMLSHGGKDAGGDSLASGRQERTPGRAMSIGDRLVASSGY